MTFCQANASGKGFTTLSVLSAHADESLRIKGLLSESQASLIPLRIVTSGKEKKKYIYTCLHQVSVPETLVINMHTESQITDLLKSKEVLPL